MPSKSKAARKVRTKAEFSMAALTASVAPRKQSSAAWAWDIADIRAARDDQMTGQMRRPARLAESLRTDDAMFTAYTNRLAPARGLEVRLDPANDTTRARAIAVEGDGLFGPRGVGVTTATLADINGDLANHGFAVGKNTWTPRPDGSRVDVQHTCWPMSEVRWNAPLGRLETYVEGGSVVPIEHGDGIWTVYSAHEQTPWAKCAVLIPAGMVWAARAHANRAWSAGTNAHGNAKVIGTMPPEMPIQDANGALTPEAAVFVQLLKDVASLDNPWGLKPFGSELDYIVDSSSAWQVFVEQLNNKSSAAHLIYLGQDLAKATGGSQRLSVEQLFGVRNDIVEGDLDVLMRGVLTGIIEPWCALNFGDSTLAPRRIYLIPDADEDARLEAISKRHEAFNRAVAAYKGNGFALTQEYLDELALTYAVKAPRWPIAV